MKKLLFLGSFLAGAALSLQGISTGHGGTYRGPGDTVPPGGGGGVPGGGAPSPGPSVPGGGGPSRPGNSGPTTPGVPTGAPGQAGNPSISPTGSWGLDLTLWDFWWGFNKDPYLALKSKIHGPVVQTGSSDFFLGHDQLVQAKNTRPPSEVDIRDKVVPALLAALEKERANDILDSSLIALAKIGDVLDESGASRFEQIIVDFLDHPSQQVAESAAIALGILANDESIPVLVALLKDEPAGRKLVGKTEVPLRTRAFAAYGLGLIAWRTSSNEKRQDIAEHLIDVLEWPQFSRRDIKVGAMTALGLTLIDSDPEVTPEKVLAEEQRGGHRRHVISREALIDYLLDYFDPAKARENKTTRHWFVRAHAPTAMARLVSGSTPEYKAKVAEMLLGRVGQHTTAKKEIQMSCALALGQIGDGSVDGKDDTDVKIRNELVRLVKDGMLQVRRFALIALAQSAGTPGEGENGLAGTEDVRRELLKRMARGKTGLRPWAGLSLGVLGRRLLENGQPMSDEATAALRDAASDCRSPADIGAYLLGLGLRRDREAKQICLDKLEYFADDDARGYAMIALGLIADREVIEPIQRVVRDSQYKPALLKQAAIGLGLLSDNAVVPDLIEMLAQAQGLASQAAISTALGAIGDARSIDRLVEMLGNTRITDSARGFAAAALGIVCDKEPLPWNAKISTDINYRANTVTLTGENGTGILDIL